MRTGAPAELRTWRPRGAQPGDEVDVLTGRQRGEATHGVVRRERAPEVGAVDVRVPLPEAVPQPPAQPAQERGLAEGRGAPSRPRLPRRPRPSGDLVGQPCGGTTESASVKASQLAGRAPDSRARSTPAARAPPTQVEVDAEQVEPVDGASASTQRRST